MIFGPRGAVGVMSCAICIIYGKHNGTIIIYSGTHDAMCFTVGGSSTYLDPFEDLLFVGRLVERRNHAVLIVVQQDALHLEANKRVNRRERRGCELRNILGAQTHACARITTYAADMTSKTTAAAVAAV